MVEGCSRDMFYAGLRQASKEAGLSDKVRIDWSANPRHLERILGFASPRSRSRQLFFSPDVVQIIFKHHSKLRDILKFKMYLRSSSN